ncbi:MAG: ATP-dependent 6-phosphofructokinase [Thermoplasmata archaeon]
MKIGVLTGGGDCPGLNPAIRAVVTRALDYKYEIIGIKQGWKGLVINDTMPLKLEDVEEIISKGGTILETSRTNPLKKEEEKKKLLENIRKLGIDVLVAIGGDDTLSVAGKLNEMGIKCIGIPKTMDNDIPETDYTFGYDTAVTIAVDAIERLKDTARSHRRVFVFEVMGRHAGWVALQSALAGGADYVFIPEVPLNVEDLCVHLKKLRERGKYYAIVVISEGVEIPFLDEGGKAKKDDFGHALLKEKGVATWLAKEIEKRTGFETRTAIIGHMQRGGPPTTFDRVLATRMGIYAVDLIKNKEFGRMASIKGDKMTSVPLNSIVGKNKIVSAEEYEMVKTFFK